MYIFRRTFAKHSNTFSDHARVAADAPVRGPEEALMIEKHMQSEFVQSIGKCDTAGKQLLEKANDEEIFGSSGSTEPLLKGMKIGASDSAMEALRQSLDTVGKLVRSVRENARAITVPKQW